MVIKVLTPQLANQIAAGEVVERPSSIIKELVENSIDAGANRIDIDIEQGGCKLIRIRDNGCGIAKDELPLALTRHATSKIRTLDDLDAIISLGFRGEALASISSVSRLTLTSNTATQSEAWQVYAEGRDMLPTIKPASHPVGTTVEVLDIFYNTPARRRFLKSEKTEFSHIDEVVRRIALVAPTISINLQHNGKLVKQYRSAQSDEQIERRIAAICGSSFMQKSIKLSWQHDDLTIHGWLATNAGGEPLQYFYVNGRVIKDRLLNHALKQASLATRQANSTDETLSYVIYLELDPHQVDVNVHPAKHEVRFHEARLIHDFVYQGIVMALSRRDEKTLPLSSDMVSHELKEIKLTTNRLAAGHNIFNASPFDDHDLIQTNQHVDEVGPVNYQHNSKPTKTAHSIENRLYQDLVEHVEHVERKISLQEETISSHQQAVIQSLFPSRNTPLMTIENDIELSRAVTLGRVLTIIKNRYVLLEKSHHQQQIISLLSLQKAQLVLFKQQIIRDEGGVSRERLLIPFTILLSKQEQQVTTQAIGMLHEFNLELVINDAKLQLNAVPKLMRKVNWQQLLPKLIGLLSEKALSTELKPLIHEWLIEQYLAYCREQATEWNVPQTIALLTELEQLNEQQIDIADMIKPIDLSTTIELFT